MPATSRTVSTRAGILLGGALVLAFSAPSLHADEATAPAIPHEIALSSGIAPNRSTPAVSESEGAALSGESLPLVEAFAADLPEITAAPRTQVSLQKRAPQKRAPQKRAPQKRAPQKAAAPKTSAANAAQAWKYVESGAKAISAGNASAALLNYQSALRLDPNNAYALSGVADSLLILNRNAAAEQAYRRALVRMPGNIKLQKGLASALVPQQKYTEAITLLKRVANASPRDFDVMYQLAQVLTWTKRYEEADPYYRRALALQPANAAAWTAWGESLSFDKNPSAKSAFLGALKAAPNYTRARLGLGNLYLWNAEYGDASNAFKMVLAREPGNLEALIGLGDALTFTRAPGEAIPYYQRALKIAPQSLPAQLGLGRALIQNKREKEGLPYIQSVLAREPRNSIALQLLAGVQAGSTSDSDAALATLQRLLATQTDPAEQANTWLQIAQIQSNAGASADAEAAFKKALDLAPRDAEISLAYAQSLLNEGETAAARTVVDSIVQNEPGNVRALTMQVILESKTGSSERASSLANRLLALDLSTPEDALVLANALRVSGNADAAKQVLERLAGQDTEDPEVALQVAVATRDAGMYDVAAPLFQKVLSRQPGNRAARFKYAEMLLWQNQYDDAARQTAILLNDDAGDNDARALSATIALRRDETTGLPIAEAAADAILAGDSHNVSALVLKTQTLSLRQRFAEAVTAAQAALDAQPSNLEARLILARNLYYARQTPASIAQYRELIKRAPADVSVKLELAKIYLDQNQLSDAEALYRDVLITSGALLPPIARGESAKRRSYARVSPSLKPLRGEKFYKANAQRNANAQRTGSTPGLRRIAADTAAPTVPSAPGTTTAPAPNDTAPTANSADTPETTAPNQSAPLAPQAGSTPSAPVAIMTPAPTSIPTGNLPDGINTAPVAPTLDEQIVATIGLGEVRRRQGRYDEAIDYFNAALQSDSANVEARVGLAQALRGKTEYLQSLAEADRILATDPSNLDARVLRAQLLADTGQDEEAKEELNALVASLPAAPSLQTYLDLSTAFVGLENYDAALQLLQTAKQDYPNRTEVTTRLGETYTFARRWDEALGVWNGLLAVDPNDTSAILGQARVYNYSNRLADAETHYRRVLELEPNSYAALADLADVLARQSEFPDAIALYRRAIAQNPNDLKTRVELARVLRYDRQFAEAEAVTNDVIATDARYAPAYTERALARSGQGNDETAIADARAALEITPNDLNAQLGLAEVLSYAERYDESITLYQAALQRDPQNQKARVELAAALSYAGRYDEALMQANGVLKENPQNVDAQIIRADTLARAGRTREAINSYNTILQTDSRNLRARVGLAEAYTYAQQYDNSLRVYDQLIAIDPDNVAYKIAKGRTLSYARRYPQAVSTLRPVVAANPGNIQARLALAEAMTNSGNPGLRREAIGQYQTVLRSDAQNTDARIGLGRVYSYSGKYSDANRELNEVLKIYPDNRDARFALAENQRFSGKPFEARDNYERVLKTDATNVGARAGLLSVRRETAVAVTPAFRNFSDTNGVHLRSYSLGAVVPTRAGTFGVIGETGTYEDDGESRDRRALSLLLAKSFGSLQARLLLSRVHYGSAPSKTLYDLLVSRRNNARKRWYANIRKLDVIESLGAVDNGITDRQIRVGGEYPLARRFDLAVELIRHSYSDGNSRTSLSPSLYYRVIDGQPQGKPVLRVGVGYQYDNTRNTSPLYYTPQDYKTFALLADYVKEQGRLRYGIYAAHPLSDSTGSGSGGGPNRPSDTLFGFMNYDVNEVLELFVNGGIVRGPSYDSNEITAGATVRFH